LIGLTAAGSLKGIISVKLGSFSQYFSCWFHPLQHPVCGHRRHGQFEQEAQQLQFLVAMPLIGVGDCAGADYPEPATPMATWASIFPLTAPLVMFTRIALDQTVPRLYPRQIALSIGLLIVTIYG